MHRLSGIILIVISAATFGSLGILGRYAFADGLDAITLLFIRFTVAAVVMNGLLLIRHERLPGGSNLISLIGMGAIGYVGQSFCYLTALNYASPGLVALLLYPAIVALLSISFLHEKVTRPKIIALIVALLGVALTVNPEGGQLPGILLAVTAAIVYSIYIIVGTRVMKKVTAIQSSSVIFASAGATFGVLMAANGPHLPRSGHGWGIIFLIILIPTLIAVVAFLAGLPYIGPTNAAMLSTLEPIVTVLLAAWLLGEHLNGITLLGGGFILGAVILLSLLELHRERKLV
jgi:drug/metabolite transporter (DMT)-like permease